MKVTIHLDTTKENIDRVLAYVDQIATGDVVGPKSTKRAAKPAMIEEDVFEDDEDTTEDDDTEAEAAPKKSGATKEAVIEALQAYAEENGRPAAKKILAKFKVKSIHDLEESDYAKVIKALA